MRKITTRSLDDAAAVGLLAGLGLMTAAFLAPQGQVGLAVAALVLLLPSLVYGAR